MRGLFKPVDHAKKTAHLLMG